MVCYLSFYQICMFADLRLSKWDEVIKDCNYVLEQEPQNVKGRAKYSERKVCQVFVTIAAVCKTGLSGDSTSVCGPGVGCTESSFSFLSLSLSVSCCCSFFFLFFLLQCVDCA